jgi:hypothetical protein
MMAKAFQGMTTALGKVSVMKFERQDSLGSRSRVKAEGEPSERI